MTPRFTAPLTGSYERASEPYRTANDTSDEAMPVGLSFGLINVSAFHVADPTFSPKIGVR